MKKSLNQKLINLIEYYNLINANFLLSDVPLKRNVVNVTTSSSGTKLQKLKSLKKSIQLIKNCELKKNATNLVFGDGNIDAKIMIIGEGPGAQEDVLGKPFVGRAGKLLDKMLESIHLNRTKVYISNVVNYRPPANRRPTEEEIAKYLPYLKSHPSGAGLKPLEHRPRIDTRFDHPQFCNLTHTSIFGIGSSAGQNLFHKTGPTIMNSLQCMSGILNVHSRDQLSHRTNFPRRNTCVAMYCSIRHRSENPLSLPQKQPLHNPKPINAGGGI